MFHFGRLVARGERKGCHHEHLQITEETLLKVDDSHEDHVPGSADAAAAVAIATAVGREGGVGKKGARTPKETALSEQGGTYGNLGNAYFCIREMRSAKACHEKDLERQAPGSPDAARALSNLGNVLHAMGRYARARECHVAHLGITCDNADQMGQARALMGVGNATLLLWLNRTNDKRLQQQLGRAAGRDPAAYLVHGREKALALVGSIGKPLGRWRARVAFQTRFNGKDFVVRGGGVVSLDFCVS